MTNIGGLLQNIKFGMQIAHPSSMIVSEHKRNTFDKDGSLDKMEIVRCIRKKQASPSFLPAFSQSVQGQQTKQTSSFQDILEYFIWAVIILCVVMLVFNFSGISLAINSSDENYEFDSSDPSQQAPQKDYFKEDQTEKLNEGLSKKQQASNKYSDFIQGLQKHTQTKSSDKIKLNQLKMQKFKNDEKSWTQFLQRLADSMQCCLENGKIICQKTLSP